MLNHFLKARDGLLRELELLGADDIVMSTNIPIRKDGLPYANQRQPDDPGVAIYFTLDGQPQCIPCDKWDTVAQNLRAVELTIGALRGLERWGAKEMVNAAFRGFKALPESVIVTPYTTRPWYEVLQVQPDASHEVVRAAYRNLAAKYHPDNQDTGDNIKFIELQNAYKEFQS
jgi:hypothetical protein